MFKNTLIIKDKKYPLKALIQKWSQKPYYKFFPGNEFTIETKSYYHFFDATGFCTGVANKKVLELDLWVTK
jgi:hypothetical protein